MASTDRQRWARVPPGLAWERPGLPTKWTRVLPTPAGYTAGYVLLDVRRDRPLRVWAEHLEFRETPPQDWTAAPPTP